jgi:2-polyprenyl-6-methoxyphenol hydroxylase-like FAD-dependent oxidoreductase
VAAPRRAEIAGAGIAGLATAAVLAQRGWRVRVHERSPELRELGAAIYLKENSLRVLDAIGVLGRLATNGEVLTELHMSMDDGRVTRRDVSGDRVICMLRTELQDTLAEAAANAGAEIVTSSHVVGADPSGELRTEDGEVYRADLVVGADGVNSEVRHRNAFGARVKGLGEGATRLLMPRIERESWHVESWSGQLRVGYAPCSSVDTYVYLLSPNDDETACEVPLRVDYWKRRFPHLHDILDRAAESPAVRHTHSLVRCDRWAAGRIALLGDSAHAQPPNLGQGAGLAIANAWTLAEALDGPGETESILRAWEQRCRPLSRSVQKWSCFYSRLARSWPTPLYRLRPTVMRGLARFGPTRRRWIYLWRGGVEGTDQTIYETAVEQGGVRSAT